MNKMTVNIAGMHCRSCELLVEGELKKVSGVTQCDVNHKTGTVAISYAAGVPEMEKINEAVKRAGYTLGTDESSSFVSQKPEDYRELGGALLFVIAGYFLFQWSGLSHISLEGLKNPASAPVALLVGLVAGLSTCLALVGGLVLGVAADYARKHPDASAGQKILPHLLFNAGRVVGFALLGGLLGSVGSVFQLSFTVLGAFTLVVALVMLVLGLRLLGIFPRLERVTFALPKGIGRFFGLNMTNDREYSGMRTMILGALTFFLPCGFTQAMQLFAVGSGSFIQGAFIMGFFALGTTPGLLGIGGLTAALKGVFARRFFRFSGIVVVGLSLFNISNAFSLLGWSGQWTFLERSAGGTTTAPEKIDTNVAIENGVQIIRMTESTRGYSPATFTVKRGMPVRWVIDARDQYSCASSLVVPSLGIRKNLTAGENVIEFTPQAVGRIAFSCTMGMYTGAFTVVEAGKDSVTSPQANVPQRDRSLAQNNPDGDDFAARGCGMMGGGRGSAVLNR